MRRIGEVGDPESLMVGPGKVHDATIWSGNLVVPIDNNTGIAVVDPDGATRLKAGRAGDGPGEFKLIAGLGVTAYGHLWIFDFGHQRMTILSNDGTVVNTIPCPGIHMGAVLSNDSVVVGLREGFFGTDSRGQLFTALRRKLEGAPEILGTHQFQNTRFKIPLGRGFVVGRQPFGNGPVWAPWTEGEGFFFFNGEAERRDGRLEFKLILYKAEGDPVVLPLSLPEKPLTRQVLTEWIDRNFSSSPGTSLRFGQVSEHLVIPEVLPPVRDLVANSDGDVLIRTDDGPNNSEWVLISQDGTLKSRFSLPVGSRILEAHWPHLWVLEYDDLDVPHLARYRAEVAG